MSNKTDKPETDEIDCLEAFDYLYAYLNDEIRDPVELRNIKHHLSHCKSCFSRAQMEKELNQRMRQEGEQELPQSIKSRMRNILDEL